MSSYISIKDPIAISVYSAIHSGNLDAMRRLLDEHPHLSTARFLGNSPKDKSRTLLHVIADWPGYFPKGGAMTTLVISAGAEVNAHFGGPDTETPLHWAASCNDVEVIAALLGGGADIEAGGSCIGGGPPLNNAVAFGQWDAARMLYERGAAVSLQNAAGLGAIDSLRTYFAKGQPSPVEIDNAFWFACHGGRQDAAEFLLDYRPEISRVPDWGKTTPLDAAVRGGAYALVKWLRGLGAYSYSELINMS